MKIQRVGLHLQESRPFLTYFAIIHEQYHSTAYRIGAAAGKTRPLSAAYCPGGVVLGDNQALRGYTLLLADPMAVDLNQMAGAARQQFLADMARIGDALLEVCGAALINYQILGNIDRNLHAHIHPRYADEPETTRLAPPFSHPYLGAAEIPFDAERERPLRDALARKLRV